LTLCATRQASGRACHWHCPDYYEGSSAPHLAHVCCVTTLVRPRAMWVSASSADSLTAAVRFGHRCSNTNSFSCACVSRSGCYSAYVQRMQRLLYFTLKCTQVRRHAYGSPACDNVDVQLRLSATRIESSRCMAIGLRRRRPGGGHISLSVCTVTGLRQISAAQLEQTLDTQSHWQMPPRTPSPHWQLPRSPITWLSSDGAGAGH
jgi:hypothetical protein